jgi:hypothetical protein
MGHIPPNADYCPQGFAGSKITQRFQRITVGCPGYRNVYLAAAAKMLAKARD